MVLAQQETHIMTGIFGGGSTPLPVVKAPTALPDDKRIARSARRNVATKRNEGGRKSTLLTSGGRETLGTG
jgi:hypothetical protein